jgi:serine/threonine protein kinase
MTAHKRLSEDYAASLVHDMILAVRYLHDHGIVHRDLKLDNFVFLKDLTLKLIDFGLSKHLDGNDLAGQCVGTVDYMAPEILEGRYDHRCDIWSLGIILFMLLTGSRPFVGQNTSETKQKIKAEDPAYDIRIPNAPPTVISPMARDLLEKMLKKNPDDRITLQDALAHPFIAQRRIKTLRVESPLNRTASNASVERAASTGSVGGDASPFEVTVIDSSVGDGASSLVKFGRLCKFEKALLKSVASTLTWQQLSQLKTSFERMDCDEDGKISVDDLQRALASLR